MRDLLVLLAHLMTIVATLLGPGGAKAVVVSSSVFDLIASLKALHGQNA